MSRLHIDLGLWENGTLSSEQVISRHPDAGVDELIELDGLLMEMAREPEPIASNWVAVRVRIREPKLGFLERAKAKLGRPLIVAITATTLTGSAAVAGVPQLREAAREAVGKVTALLGIADAATPEIPKWDEPSQKVLVPDVRTDTPPGPPPTSQRESDKREGALDGGSAPAGRPGSTPSEPSTGSSQPPAGGSGSASTDASTDSSKGNTDTSSDSSSDSSKDGSSEDSSSDSSEDCSSESDACWDGEPQHPSDDW